MGGAQRQQRQFLLYGRPGAAVFALLAFGVLQLVRPTTEFRHLLIAMAAFAVVTVPLSWLALRRFSLASVTRAVLVHDVAMIATYTYLLDRESLLVVVYLAPIAFAALIFGPRTTLLLTGLSIAAAIAVGVLREYDFVAVAADVIVLVAIGAIVAGLSRERRDAERQLELDAAALRIAQRFRESLELDHVLGLAVEELGRATGVDRVRLRLVGRGGEPGALYQWLRHGLEPLDSVVPPMMLRTLVSREPVLVRADDANTELRAYLDEFGARSFVGYPLIWNDRPIAALGLFDHRERDRGDDVVPLLDRVAPQLAAALVQADLFREQQTIAEMREELVANVSHELRTPLTATIGFLRTLEREDVALSPEQRREFLAVARREAERLARLVSDLLQLTRLDRGHVPLVREPASIAGIVARAIAQLDLPEERNVRLDVAPELSAPLDSDRMLQVFSNLLSNAARHGEGAIDVTAEQEDGIVRIAVSDEGGGVDAANVEGMFEPFARWSRHGDSSGLGLAIARRLVEAHGGQLVYRPRQGANPHAFVVEVPTQDDVVLHRRTRGARR